MPTGVAMATIILTMNELPSITPALLRLCSPSLPIGAFAYSGGMESAVEAGWVVNEASAGSWISALLEHQLAHVDLPLLLRLHRARMQGGKPDFDRWQQWTRACRETEELRLQDEHQGVALRRLLLDLGHEDVEPWLQSDCTLLAAWACAASAWGIGCTDALFGFAWSFCEAQVHAAIRLVPLGQTSGQRILGDLVARIPEAVRLALALPDDDIGSSLPALAIGSSWHPWQYTRLFRS